MINIIIGMVIGGLVSIATLAVMDIAADPDEYMEGWPDDYREGVTFPGEEEE